MAKNDKLLTDCRVAVFEVILTKEQKTLFCEFSEQIKESANRYFREWIVAHTNAGSSEKLRQWRADRIAWHKLEDARIEELKRAGVKSKVKLKRRKLTSKELPCPVKFDSPGFKTDDIRKWSMGCDDHSVKGRCIGLAIKRIDADFRKRPEANGAFNAWIAVLLDREAIRNFTKPLPIPFDAANCRGPNGHGLIDEGDNRYSLRVALNNNRNEYWTIPLLTWKRKAAKQRVHLQRIMDERYKFMGSQFFHRDGKWMVAVCYEDLEKRSRVVDPELHAVLCPGAFEPWLLKKTNGAVYFRGGTGDHVKGFRRRLLAERRQRSEHYRYSGSNRKGRGGAKAREPWQKLSSKWKHFQKRYNDQVTTSIVRELVDGGIGSLTYYQPADSKSDSRLLSSVGSDGGQRGLQGWEWHQVKTMLAAKCQREGIVFSVAKFTAKSSRRRKLQKT